jgi:hypothetical protein
MSESVRSLDLLKVSRQLEAGAGLCEWGGVHAAHSPTAQAAVLCVP